MSDYYNQLVMQNLVTAQVQIAQTQAESTARLAAVAEAQLADARRGQRFALWTTVGSLSVAAGSLIVAIFALIVSAQP